MNIQFNHNPLYGPQPFAFFPFSFLHKKLPGKPAGLTMHRLLLAAVFLFLSLGARAQTVPSPTTSCPSGDLELVKAELPNTSTDPCKCDGSRTLWLSINNKTGSTRTSFAFWGTLKVYDADNNLLRSENISGCNGPINANSVNRIAFRQIDVACNESYRLEDLFLAWTDASKKSVCPLDPASISPKCGTLPSIVVEVGVDATVGTTNATCTAGGSITVSPYGGKPPYTVKVNNITRTNVTTSTQFTNLAAGTYPIQITDANGCVKNRSQELKSTAGPSVNAGTPFIKTCIAYTSGGQIGETAEPGHTYSWSSDPVGFTSNLSNPTVDPSATTRYTVVKTNTTSGCTATASVTIMVNTATPSVSAGIDFDKTCIVNPNGKLIGESSVSGFSYSWLPVSGLSDATIGNPLANPAATTTYTVKKTNTSSGCFSTASVKVTVDNDLVDVSGIGADFLKTCVTNPNGKIIGETPVAGFTYAWLPTGGLSDASIGNPTANPGATTIYTVKKTKNSSGCFNTATINVTVENDPVSVSGIGADFLKTCVTNPNGKIIGETPVAGFTYAWLPTGGLSDASIGNPTANPGATTIYTVKKTKTSSGCFNTATINVTVENDPVSVSGIGADFLKTCVTNPNGKIIGETPVAGFTYSWLPTGGLSDASIGNPTANPGATTSYTVKKTKTSSGCFNTATINVTVENDPVSVSGIGADFLKTCVTNPNGKIIGETPVAGFTYSWLPTGGLSDASIGNPTANPGATTSYTVKKTKTSSGCFNTATINVTVNNTPPANPSICVVQPSLCGPATGSITVKSPLGADYQYSVNNGANWQSSNVFNNLAGGTVSGIKVQQVSNGCISAAVDCNASDCSQPVTAQRSSVTETKGQPTTETKQKNVITTLEPLTINGTTVKAIPNPFKDVIRFVVNAPSAGQGSLDIYNTSGQKIKTVYNGKINAGSQTFELRMSTRQAANLVYLLRIGNEKISGMIMQVNR